MSETQKDKQAAAVAAGGGGELIVMRHKDIATPAVATRKALEEVYKAKGWKEDPNTSPRDVPGELEKAKQAAKKA